MEQYYARDPMYLYTDVMRWAEQAMQELSSLDGSRLPGPWAHQVANWRDALANLEGSAQTIGDPHRPWPDHSVSLDRLVQQAQQLYSEVAPFLRHPAVQSHLAEPVPGPQIAGAQVERWQIPPRREEQRAAEQRPTPVPVGGHTLPPLPYAYDALEPYIDEATMRLHHDRHHKSYVDGLNRAERMLAQARAAGDYALVKHWEREAAFHGAGHYLHTIFWPNMSPQGGGDPTGPILEQIRHDFGDVAHFRQHFSAAAENVEGGGWAILVWAPRAHRLEILTAEKHQNLSQWDVVPLLVLDVWEHAYYLQHQNDRKAYIEDWWNVVNWGDVNQRFDRARRLVWAPT